MFYIDDWTLFFIHFCTDRSRIIGKHRFNFLLNKHKNTTLVRETNFRFFIERTKHRTCLNSDYTITGDCLYSLSGSFFNELKLSFPEAELTF